jgi:hypothetical protein
LFDLRESHVLAFEKRFLSNDLESFYSCENIDEKCNMFYDFMHDAMSVIPQTMILITNSDAPWMTPFIKFLIDNRWKAYRRRNWTLFNSFKLKAKQEIWRAKKSFFLKKAKTIKGLWSFVNLERGARKDCISSLVNEFNGMHDLTNAFNEHFCAVMNPTPDNENDVNLHDDSWFPSFGAEDIWQLLRHLPSKATGSDDIPTLLYKKSALILAEPLYHLIVCSLQNRVFPAAWKIADVIPVPKSSGKTVEEYRPISLLPIPAKLMEKLILKSMRSRFTGLLGENQFGIRRGSSSTHAVIAAHDVMTKHADDPKIGASVFIAFDYSKAFDKIDHQKLLTKLVDMNLPSGFILLLSNYLHHRQQRVRVNGFKSALKCVTSGVPQGSLLGPFLFGLFISSLKPRFATTFMIKYVDDVSLIVSIRKEQALCDLERALSEIEHLSLWSSAHCLTLNVNKTTGLIYSRGIFKDEFNVESFLSDVNFQKTVRFLGVVLDENLSWKPHISFIEKKCSQRMYILRRLKSVTTKDEYFLIYCGIIRTLIEYACPSFIGLSSADALRLQRIQKRCLKVKNCHDAPDLTDRRWFLASSVFKKLPFLDTSLKSLLPASLPSGRFSVPFCRTSLRRSSFIPLMTIADSGVFCD